MKKISHEEWLFLFLTLVGLSSFVGMGWFNWILGDRELAMIEWGMAGLGLVNGWFFWWTRKIALASHIVLVMMFVLLTIVLVKGGMMQMGWLWVFTYPPLAFALRSVATASWYVSGLGLVIAGLLASELLGLDVSVYNQAGLIQLCLSYMVVSLMVSIAERAHERLSRDLRTFKTAVEQSGEMMVITDPEGIVLWANEATERVTGFSVGEATGKKAGLLWGKLMEQDFYEKMWQRIKVEKKLFVGEIQNHRKDTEHFYSTISIYPLLDERGEVEYFVATQRDITEQKEVDQMKTDFVSLVSHQLRTPLSAMRWNLEMLLAGDLGKLSAKQGKVVSQVEQSNSRMIKLITTLLNISRIESGRLIVDPAQIELGKFLTEMMQNCQSNSRGQRIVLKLPDKRVEVGVDPMLLRQILNNFVNNASKYSEPDKEITVELVIEGDEYKIVVSDLGYGIPRVEQRKIFGKFFRASNVSKYDTDGTGMGLYIGAMLAKLMGGRIGFESTVGQGSKFWVTLPIKGIAAKAGEVRLG